MEAHQEWNNTLSCDSTRSENKLLTGSVRSSLSSSNTVWKTWWTQLIHRWLLDSQSSNRGSGPVSGSKNVTLRMVATTSLSFSLQRSFWTQKSSCCSSCLSAGRRSDERNLGNNWQSLYLTDRWVGKRVTSDARDTSDFTHHTGQNTVKGTWRWRLGRGPAPVPGSGSVCWSIFWRKSQWPFHKHQGSADGSSNFAPEPDLKIRNAMTWTAMRFCCGLTGTLDVLSYTHWLEQSLPWDRDSGVCDGFKTALR